MLGTGSTTSATFFTSFTYVTFAVVVIIVAVLLRYALERVEAVASGPQAQLGLVHVP